MKAVHPVSALNGTLAGLLKSQLHFFIYGKIEESSGQVHIMDTFQIPEEVFG